jgi:hypothetical protein
VHREDEPAVLVADGERLSVAPDRGEQSTFGAVSAAIT